MPNDWFQFKQFKIHQDKCAMKVSTDACIQGAWAAQEFSRKIKDDCRILDIGTGTGLLSLMIAQALPQAHIDAIEINEDAFLQAGSNFEQSPWKQQLKAHRTSLTDFTAFKGNKAAYDCVICNPPFFQAHLESQTKARNDARHSQALSKDELAQSAAALLKDDGLFCVMYPATEWDKWLNVATQHGLHNLHPLNVRPNALVQPNRIIGLFSKRAGMPLPAHELIIYEADKSYTHDMKLLLKDYYLAF